MTTLGKLETQQLDILPPTKTQQVCSDFVIKVEVYVKALDMKI